jgi:hypothetical protein
MIYINPKDEKKSSPSKLSSLCEKIRRNMYSLRKHPLLIEWDKEVSEHLRECKDCILALKARKQVQEVLRGRLL